MAIRTRSGQAGFTIIEVMIVVGIIGILSAIVMPAVRGYTARAKVAEAMFAMGNCRTVIHEGYLSSSELLGVDGWGCEADRPSRYVFKINTDEDGKVVLTLGNEIGDGRLNAHFITLRPLNGAGVPMGEADLGNPVRRWRCGSAADGTDVHPNLLPSTCRG